MADSQTTAPIASQAETQLDEILDIALKQSATDRQFILETEAAVLEFMHQEGIRRLPFRRQNSYRRLLLHRIGGYYGLNHVVVGKGRDEIAFYKRTTNEEAQEQQQNDPEDIAAVIRTEQQMLPVPLALRVPGLVPDPSLEEADSQKRRNVDSNNPSTVTSISNSSSQQEFTRILVKRELAGSPANRTNTSARPLVPTADASTDHPSTHESSDEQNLKTAQQRQEEYERARAEIFQDQ